MAVNVLTDLDRNFLNDNFLESEDWAYVNETKMDDLPYFLKLDDGLGQYDLQHGMLGIGGEVESWKDMSDGSDSGVDAFSMKPEPLSPSSLSDSKAEPLSPASLFSDSSCDSALYAVSTTTAEMETCINSATELTQEEWDSIQSLLFEPTNVGNPGVVAVDSSVDTSSACVSECETVVFSSDMVPAVASLECVSKLAVGSYKSHIDGVRTAVGCDSKTASELGINVRTDNVNHVLNSKVKIQPKPVTSVQTAAVDKKQPSVMPVSRPVITVKLPALTATQQSQVQLSNVKPSAVTVTTATTLSTSPSLDNSFLDVRALKRHQRMIKNRESACLSRKRKKDYVQSLEQQLHSYNVENERLKSENTLLKRKVEVLQAENERLKRILPTLPKATGVLLCVVCILSLSYLPNMLSSDSSSLHSVRPLTHTGRSLLSVESGSDIEGSKSVVQADEHRELTDKAAMQRGRLSLLQDVTDLVMSRRLEGSGFGGRFLCSTFFNSTESRRLVSELEGWVLRHEEESRRQREFLKMEQAKVKPRKKYYTPRRLKAAMHGNLQTHELPAHRYELQVFNGANQQYENFMEAINRRNDTFYVVSFRRDHLLLPATAHNSTMRPRMSVMMPAVSLNETMQPPVGSIAMMQIDCEVTATRLIHIEKSAVPPEMINRTVTGSQQNTQSGRDWLSPDRR